MENKNKTAPENQEQYMNNEMKSEYQKAVLILAVKLARAIADELEKYANTGAEIPKERMESLNSQMEVFLNNAKTLFQLEAKN